MTDLSHLRGLIERATKGPWGVGADLIRIHPNWRDDHGNMAAACVHRNGYIKTIASVGKEDGDWRDILEQTGDAALIVAAVNSLPALLDEIERLRLELRWIELFAQMRSEDDSKTFARVNRGALRNIAERARLALTPYEGKSDA